MSLPADEARARAVSTYNLAADVYDGTTNSFWEQLGRRTVEPAPRPTPAVCFEFIRNLRTGYSGVQTNVVYAVAQKT